MRMLPLDGAYSLQINSERGLRTYDKRRDGTMEVPQSDARTMVREGVAVPANTAGPTAHIKAGFTCERCGRRNWFRKCGHCGQET